MLREWKFRALTPVFTAWSGLCAEKRAVLRRAIGHAFNRLLGLTFGAWLGKLRTSKGQKSAAEAALFRLLHRHLTATFVAWRDDVRETGEGRRVQQQRAAGRMMNRHFVATFLPWAELTRRLSAARLSAEELGAACKRRGMQAHMLAWVAQRREQEQAREMVLQSGLYGVAQGPRCDASQCITVAAAVRTLVEWRGAARASAEHRAQLNKKAYVLGTRRTLFSLFYKWSAVPRQRRAVVTRAAFAICFRARRRMDSKRRELADRTFNKKSAKKKKSASAAPPSGGA